MKKIIRYMKDNRLGAVTIILSLSYMFLGIPAQIIKIWETRSVEEISILMFSLLMVQSVFWVLYGIRRKDWFVVTANSFGGLFSALIVIEYFLFK